MPQGRAPALALHLPGAAAEGGFADLAILAGGVLLWFLCARDPADLPALAPWQFSWADYLATAFALLWFARGCRAVPVPRWQKLAFAAGLLSIYAVLQTRFDYWAQHMFFLNRVQHFAMQDLGPFLIALAAPGRAILSGMPSGTRRLIGSRPMRMFMRGISQPAVAFSLFVGLLFLWLIPRVQFAAMLNPTLYGIMNWSMVLSGLLFWCLALDPRPYPEARSRRFTRLALVMLIMFPMILAGTIVSSTDQDLYVNYNLCGRMFPAIGAIADQQIGSLIIWLPSGSLGALATMLLARRMFEEDDRRAALDVMKYRAQYPEEGPS